MKLVEQREKNLVSYNFSRIHNGDVNVPYEDITSLEGAPKEVVGDFNCGDNELRSLEGAPAKVGGNFYCSFSQLTSLKGAPKEIGEGFYCEDNELRSLEGAPQKVGRNFHCAGNELASLDGAPQEVGGDFLCQNNRLTSLKDIHKQIKKMNGIFSAASNPIKSHVLGLLLIKGIIKVRLDNKEVEAIINRYLGTGDIFSAQEELIDAGLEEYAKL
jgi:hypothetical protein